MRLVQQWPTTNGKDNNQSRRPPWTKLSVCFNVTGLWFTDTQVTNSRMLNALGLAQWSTLMCEICFITTWVQSFCISLYWFTFMAAPLNLNSIWMANTHPCVPGQAAECFAYPRLYCVLITFVARANRVATQGWSPTTYKHSPLRSWGKIRMVSTDCVDECSKWYYNDNAYLTAVNRNIHSQIFLLWGLLHRLFQTVERATEPAASSGDKKTFHKQWSIHWNYERDMLQMRENSINSELQLFCQKRHGCAVKIILWEDFHRNHSDYF